MPRYYFDVHDGLNIEDEDGSELSDLETAKAEAVRLLASMMAEEPHLFLTRQGTVVDIRTQERGILSRMWMPAPIEARAPAELAKAG